MSKLAFDYSKWDKLEISDDEDTFHPNLDKNLNVRVNRVTRDRKEEEIDDKQKVLRSEGKDLEAEALEKRRPLHLENMCRVTEERTIIQRSNGTVDRIKRGEEEFKFDDYQTFVEDNQALMEEYTQADWEKSEKMLKDHGGALLDSHSNTWFMLTTLDEEMKGNRKLVAKLGRQGQIISQIHQLAAPMKRHPRDLVHRFFERFQSSDGQGAFQQGVDHWLGQIKNRAVQKKKEQDEEAAKAVAEPAEEEQGEHVPLVKAMYDMALEDRKGPGGLDPVEVFESLPKELQECFTSGDVERLKQIAESMDDFEHHFKRCVDAGLWSS